MILAASVAGLEMQGLNHRLDIARSNTSMSARRLDATTKEATRRQTQLQDELDEANGHRLAFRQRLLASRRLERGPCFRNPFGDVPKGEKLRGPLRGDIDGDGVADAAVILGIREH